MATAINLSFTPEYEVVSSQKTKLTFNANLRAPEVVEDTAKRSTVSLTAVIDKSGSMSGEKLELVKQTCDFMLNQLSSKDKMGLVEYDSDVNELIPLSRTSDVFKQEAQTVIARMEAGSCTNLSGGLFEGVKQQQANVFVDWTHPKTATAQTESETESSVGSTVDPVLKLAAEAAAPASEGEKPALAEPKQKKSLVHKFRSAAHKVMGRTKTKKPQQTVQVPLSISPTSSSSSMRSSSRSFNSRKHFLSCSARDKSKTMFDGRDPGPGAPVDADALRSVFLFTDGLANEGITATSELVAALGQRLDSSPRVRVYTFGFGSDHSPELLAELARVGAGTYYFMEKEEAIPTAFADALGGLLSVAAQNVALEFRPADGVTVSNVHTAYATSEEAGGARRVAVGDMLSEEGKDVLFEVELPTWDSQAQRAEVIIGTLVLSYLDVQEACLRRVEVECKVGRAQVVPAGVVADEGVALQRARVETAKSMAEARKAAEEGDLVGARGMLDRCLERVEGVRSEGAFKSQLRADLQEAQRNMVDRDTYSTRGSKLMWAKQKAHTEQRSACLSDSEGDSGDEDGGERCQSSRMKTFSYANSAQKAMRTKAKALVGADPNKYVSQVLK
eukprot:CAMPEP_0196724340 /NCGR_PEP_ID=MMETSP1091-20130531/6229_1 /TAXON_ID=302021 /ORGANISM="Rhodomonas sp., Strain CCMP768" /LENGTH=616 /DNA_ID=CAMNT_0042066449 /DNA_START=26 /DNA_END=1877 /DNA_ORIENTATION=+